MVDKDILISIELNDIRMEAVLALIRAGLWEKKVLLSPFVPIDFNVVYRLAQQQSVIGLVVAGLEHVTDIKIPQGVALTLAGEALQQEQRNTSMNYFIGVVVEKMSNAGISTLLVKGQGVAQCYERPLWRVSGDIDFLLDNTNYKKAIDFVLPLSSHNNPERRYSRHKSFIVDPWYVELHGTLRSGLSARVDRLIDDVHKDTFQNNNIRNWHNGDTCVLIPGADNDIIFIFTHFIMHFYREVLGMKQICDWCRLLWTFKEEIDISLLESRIKSAGLIVEWRAFAYLAVHYLDMPEEAMPMYVPDKKFDTRAKMILRYIFNGNERGKLFRIYSLFCIFPINTIKFLPSIFFNINLLKIKERLIKD